MKLDDFNITLNEDRSAWDEFLTRSRQSSIFVTSPFLDSLKETYRLITIRNKGEIAGGTVIFLNSNGKPYKNLLPYTTYQGIVLIESEGRKYRKTLFNFEMTNHLIEVLAGTYEEFCLSNHWTISDIRPFLWYNYHDRKKGGFSLIPRYTGLLLLNEYKNFNEYVKSLPKGRRSDLQKALNFKNIYIENSDDVSILDELHDETFCMQGISRSEQEKKLMRNIVRDALINKYGLLKIAWRDSKPLIAEFLLFYKDTAYDLFRTSNAESRETGISTLLLLEFIRECYERDIRIVDFIGVNSPNRGNFKLSFNLDIRLYFNAILERNIDSLSESETTG